MILKDIYLYPDLVDYPLELTSGFRYKSRSLCNFLDREVLKPLKFKTDDFRRIVLVGRLSPIDELNVNSSNVLRAEVHFNKQEYKSLGNNQLNEYFIGLLMEGLEKIEKHIDIPKLELLEGVEKFRFLNYVNQWTYKSKLFRELGIRCYLNCKLTIDAFCLILVIYKKKEIVFEKEILRTDPDEIIFMPYLKDINYDGESLIVIDKFGKTVFALSTNQVKDIGA